MRYGLIGEKLGHSFSKEIHERLGRYEYELREIAPDELESFIKSGDFEGINVTIPYKEAVIPYLDDINEEAAGIGAVNTIVRQNGRLVGYNTDAGGMKLLAGRLGADFKGRTVLITGSGGTGKTARFVAEQLGARVVKRVSRRESDDAISYEQACNEYNDAEVIINTTPLGMYPNVDAAALDIREFGSAEAVMDAVYNPLRTSFVLSAQDRGIKAEGGLYMLIAQAVLAAELFTGESMPEGIIDDIYSELLLEKQNIVLIGMPGSGKTTLGRMLASDMGREFIDSDDEIEKRAGMSVSEIFSEYGETYFRNIESEIIKEVSLIGGRVIACGGGTVLRDENVKALSMNGRIIYLNRDIAELAPTDDRPLADNSEKIKSLYDERLPVYRAACDVEVRLEGFGQDAADKIRSVLL